MDACVPCLAGARNWCAVPMASGAVRWPDEYGGDEYGGSPGEYRVLVILLRNSIFEHAASADSRQRSSRSANTVVTGRYLQIGDDESARFRRPSSGLRPAPRGSRTAPRVPAK